MLYKMLKYSCNFIHGRCTMPFTKYDTLIITLVVEIII